MFTSGNQLSGNVMMNNSTLLSKYIGRNQGLHGVRRGRWTFWNYRYRKERLPVFIPRNKVLPGELLFKFPTSHGRGRHWVCFLHSKYNCAWLAACRIKILQTFYLFIYLLFCFPTLLATILSSFSTCYGVECSEPVRHAVKFSHQLADRN